MYRRSKIMTKWWYCPNCSKVTDEFESSKSKQCPRCRFKKEKEMKEIFQTRFYKVENKLRHHNAEEFYFYCIDTTGRKYLFTGAALDEANTRVAKNPEDIPEGIPVLNPEQILADRDNFLADIAKLGNAIEHCAGMNRIWLYTVFFAVPVSFGIGFLFNHFI